MSEIKIRQDNRITTSRYELSTMEKRIMYVIVREIRKKYVLIDKEMPMEDMTIKMTGRDILKSIGEEKPARAKKALKALRQRSFEYDNGLPEDDPGHQWFEVGFINYGEWEKGGNIEVQVSKKILPFFVELTRNFTEFSLIVAISLKSKWSQRMYELCSKWKNAGGFRIEIQEMREMFKIQEQYKMYGSLKKFVIMAAHKELKELYEKGESDLFFEFTEHKTGRTVESLSVKVISKGNDQQELSLDDLDYIVRTQLHEIFDTKNKPKNKEFVAQTMTALRLDVQKLKHCYSRLNSKALQAMEIDEKGRYMRFIIMEDYLSE